MVELKIKRLVIQDFKGISNLTVPFSDGMTNVYGDNATGKSTIYDALMWLLFGKDSSGRSQFEIKPVDRPGAMPTVMGEFELNGSPMRLRKIMKEVWSSPRGSAQKVFSGHTVEYSINEVPYKEREYMDRLCAVVDEKKFLMLTRVGQFASVMKWQDRRKVLFEMGSLPDDEDVLACEERFEPLALALEGRTVEEFRKVIEKERRGLRTDLDAIPYRLDELAKQNARIVIPDEEKLKQRGKELQEKIAALDASIARIDNGSEITDMQARLKEVEAHIAQLDAENRAFRAEQKQGTEVDRRPELKRTLERALSDVAACEKRLAMEKSTVDRCLQSIEGCREEWRTIDAMEYTGDDCCPTCGQPLPADKVAEAKATFEVSKQKQIDIVMNKVESFKTQQAASEELVVRYEENLAEAKSVAEKLQAELDGYVPPVVIEIRDMEGYTDRRARLLAEKSALNGKLISAHADQRQLRNDMLNVRDLLSAELREGIEKLGARAALEDGKAREQELYGEQHAIAERLEYIENMIALCESFSVHKCGLIEQTINGPFRLAKFKLFREQINGSVVDCCDVIVDDVPFADLNNAMKINVGLDIINVLSDWYGLRVPLVVDNAESVTDLLNIDGQVIRLIVSEQDKELRIECD